MLNLLNDLFGKKIPYKSTLPYTAEQMRPFIPRNRASLGEVGDWIDEEAFAKSYFQYGVPGFLRPVINKPVGDAPTYTDLMALIAAKHFDQVNYLEIGVSVGKNFFQMLNILPKASLTAFDIEEINPVLARFLSAEGRTEWATPAKSIKKKASSLTKFSYQQKQVAYLSADVWDTNSWARLQGQKFNLVFSDALHTPEAILFEFEMLVKYGLLDQKFIIVWDDLVGKMQRSFFRIIKKYNDVYGIKEVFLVDINGWVGENEGPHSVGIISNFQF